jgi:inositol-phosphate phosphatase / L-galactose 1-phosphate phosphatase / histidinol-phosphatase
MTTQALAQASIIMAAGRKLRTKDAAAFAESLANEAGPIALRYFRRPIAVEAKADASPVTEADRRIEALIRQRIRARYPTHGLLGEEHGREAGSDSLTWVIDPIDGTKSFISGMPTFGTLIALLDGATPVLGVVDHPALRERWVGRAGMSTRCNGVVCRTSACTRLSDAMLYATTPDMFQGAARTRFNAVSGQARQRRFGGDCYAYALLASGYIDVVIEAQLQPYDYMALVPVIEGAGGIITDWRGGALGLDGDGRVVAAATEALHGELLEQLNA